jgi:hypothetical protein
MTTSAMVLDESFEEAVPQKSPNEGGWIYVVMPDQAGETVVVRLGERIA